MGDFLVNKGWQYFQRRLMWRVRPWIPRQLLIGITYQCQCKCIHCMIGPSLNKNKYELSQQNICALINIANRLGFIKVSFFGGEPLLREDLPELIRFSTSKGLSTTIYTNGILLSREMITLLQKAGLKQCNVSLDSVYSEKHDSLRGVKGCFEKAVEGIQNVVAAGIRCFIWSYIKKSDVKDQNLKDIRAVIELGRKLKVDKVVILFPIASGNWLCGSENILTREERDMVRELHNPPFVVMEFSTENSYCTAGERMVYITPEGYVSPCPAVPHFYGNIREEPFLKILKKIRHDFVKSRPQGCGDCVMNSISFREEIGVGIPKSGK